MKRISHCIGPILLMILVLGAGGGCTKKARAHRALKAGNRDFFAEKYDDAEIEYKNALELDRGNPTAIGQLGRIYAKEGRIIEARQYLTVATNREPNSLPYVMALGQVFAAFHDSTNSAKIAWRILSAQPTNEEAMLLLLDSFIPAPAVRQQLASLPHAAENPAYHVTLGSLAIRQQNLDEAQSELRLALTANPKSSRAYFALAEYYARQRDGARALQSLKKAAELAPMRSTMRLRYVDYLIASGDVEEGRKVLHEMTEKAPDYIPGWAALMNLAQSEKKYDDTLKFAETILARDDRNYDALLGQGSASLAKGDGENAVAEFEHMDAIYKKSPQVKYNLALAYLMVRNTAKAIESLNQAMTLDPGYSQAAVLLGRLYIRSGDPTSAVTMLSRFIKKAPTVGQAQLLLADAYMAEQKPDAALAIYRNLAGHLPKNPEIPLLMGVVLAGEHRHAEARAAFERCVALSPHYMMGVEQLVNIDIDDHRYQDATALVQEQINYTPKAAEPWELQSKIDVSQMNLTNAERDLLKAIELNPSLSNPYLLLAEVYVTSGKYQEALQKLNALTSQATNAAAYMQIGAIHEKLKDYEAASVAYEKVLQINSNAVPALNNLSYIYAVRLNKLDRAYELAQRARALLPFSPNVNDTLGWILFKKGDYSHALTVLEDSADKAPTDPEIQFHLGLTHYMLDEEDAARVALQRAVASPQDYPNKDDARYRLKVLNTDTTKAGSAALAELEKTLQDHPDDPVLLNRIGALQEREGAWEKAAETYETAHKQNPTVVHIMAKLAQIYAFRLNKPEKALSIATDAHKLAPDNADVSGVLGHLAYRSGDYVWALSLLETATDQISNQPELLYDLAWAYYSVGRITDAETAMQKALQSGVAFAGSEDAKQFMALAEAFNNASKVQATAGQAEKILQADAKYVPAIMVSGVAAERGGNFKAAQDAYNKALAVFPLFVPADRQLAILDAKHFQNDAPGYNQAEKARTAYPDDPEVAKSLGILSYYQAKYPKSADLLRDSVNQNRNDGEVYYYLGMDCYQLKQGKESKQDLERALALNIPDKLAAEAKRILAGLK